MFGIGTGELLLLLVLALLVLGPERMPKLARDLGKTVADLRKTSDELRGEFLNADRTLNAEKLLDVAARTASRADTGKAAEMGATMGEPATTAEPASPDVGATQAAPVAEGTGEAGAEKSEVVPEATEPPPAEPDETVFDRDLREARERMERGG